MSQTKDYRKTAVVATCIDPNNPLFNEKLTLPLLLCFCTEVTSAQTGFISEGGSGDALSWVRATGLPSPVI